MKILVKSLIGLYMIPFVILGFLYVYAHWGWSAGKGMQDDVGKWLDPPEEMRKGKL